jgi:SCO1/SenC
VSVTVDPEHDRPSRLVDYARALDANVKGWYFLTGSLSQLDTLSCEEQRSCAWRSSPRLATKDPDATEADEYGERYVLVLCPINNFTRAGSSGSMFSEVEEDGPAEYSIDDQWS